MTKARDSGVAQSWRVALRMARRANLRNKGRALLIALLLAVPVYAGATLIQVWHASYASAQREASWKLGEADVQLDGDKASEASQRLPAGSRTTRFSSGSTAIDGGGVYRITAFDAASPEDRMQRGRYVLRSGTVATRPGEATLSRPLSDALGVGVGGTVRLAGAEGRKMSVVGIIDTADELSRPIMVVSIDDPMYGLGKQHLLVDLPEAVRHWEPPALNGLSIIDRTSVAPTPAQQAVRIAGLILVVGFAAVQVGLLAAAAFSVGARRQRREMAMISALGATPSQIGRILLADGALLGFAGGTCGVIAGLVTFAAARGQLERLVNHPLQIGGPPILPLSTVLLGAVAFGLLAALGPAWSVGRMSVQSALVGREVTSRAQAIRLSSIAGALALLGLAAVIYAVQPANSNVEIAAAGAGLILLGLAAAGPSLVGVASRLTAPLTFSARVAVRHADRHRLRSGAAVAAICAAVAGSTAIIMYFSADTATGAARQPDARPGQVLVPASGAAALSADDQTALRQRMPIRAIVPLSYLPATAAYYGDQAQSADPPPDLSQTVAVGGPDLVQAVTGRRADAAVQNALERGNAVIFYPVFGQDGRTDITVGDKQVALPATLVATDHFYRRLPAVLVSEQTARRLGAAPSLAGMVLDTFRAPTPEEVTSAQSVVLAAQARTSPTAMNAPAQIRVATTDRQSTTTDPLLYVLAAVSALVTIVATAVVVGLANIEMRTDIATLSAVGAAPRTIRAIAAIQAAFIVGLGALAGILAGIAPAAGLVALRQDMTWHMAWGPLAVIVIGAPLIALALVAVMRQPKLVLTRRLR
jgi:putative ABC transport system permease protein